MAGSAIGAAFRRDRIAVVVAIVLLTALAWAYTFRLARDSMPMSGAMAMPNMMPWSATDFGFMFVMWAVMMVAMMLPSASPMILIFDRVQEKRRSDGRQQVSVLAFIGGYFLVWTGFSLFATILNWGLHTGGVLSSMMGHAPPLLGGVLLIFAGLYQWTPQKHACLDHCRSPIGFLMAHWHDGGFGAARMGLHHGIYCLGCCWMLMLLLFVLGVMNLPWVAALTVVVLVEKVLPKGEVLSRLLGVALAIWGFWLVLIV